MELVFHCQGSCGCGGRERVRGHIEDSNNVDFIRGKHDLGANDRRSTELHIHGQGVVEISLLFQI